MESIVPERRKVMPLIRIISDPSFSQKDLPRHTTFSFMFTLVQFTFQFINLKCELIVRQVVLPRAETDLLSSRSKVPITLIKVSGQMEVSFPLLDVGGLQ